MPLHRGGDERRSDSNVGRQEHGGSFKGIRAGYEIEGDASISTAPVDVPSEVKRNYEKRERIWIDRLSKAGERSVLFICGDDHVDSFAKRARELGIEVIVLNRVRVEDELDFDSGGRKS